MTKRTHEAVPGAATRDAGLLHRYRSLLAEADAWFARAFEIHRDRVACRLGCDECCVGLFDISPLDAELVAAGYRGASERVQRDLLAAANAAIETMRHLSPSSDPLAPLGTLGPGAFDELCEALERARCPALAEDGSCRIYEHRPLVCRLHGLPMWDPVERRDCGGECRLNLPARDLDRLPALHFDHGAFERRELDLMAEIAGTRARRDPEAAGTTVAAAIVRAATAGQRL